MLYTKHLREDQFKRIEAVLPGFSGTVGRPVADNRPFVEGVIWVGRNGGRWCSLPPEYGKWSRVHKPFKHWADKGVWQMIFNTLVEDGDMEWVMIDSAIVGAHQHGAGAKKEIKIKH